MWTATGIDFANTDLITDFNVAAGDRVDVHNIDANETLAGTQAFTFVGDFFANGGFTAAGQAASITQGDNTYVIFNTDNTFFTGNLAEFEFAIGFQGHVTPDASWFVL